MFTTAPLNRCFNLQNSYLNINIGVSIHKTSENACAELVVLDIV